MGRMKVHENQLRSTVRGWGAYEAGLISFIEPGLGADTGLPDCLLLVGRHWEPVELKRGPSVVKELRPSQRRWHRASLANGAQTYGLTLRNDGMVVMVALGLTGGLMSELFETALLTKPLASLSHYDVVEQISSFS